MSHRIEGVTFEQAYRKMRDTGFVVWVTKGNLLNVEIPDNLKEIQTYAFLGESIYLLWVTAKNNEGEYITSSHDFIDIWPTVKMKYPQLFEKDIKGRLLVLA